MLANKKLHKQALYVIILITSIVYSCAAMKKMSKITINLETDLEITYSELSPDKNYLAVIFANKTLQLYNTQTGKPHGKLLREKRFYNSYKRYPQSLIFTPNNKFIITQKADNILEIYDAHTVTLKKTLSCKYNIGKISLSSDSKFLAFTCLYTLFLFHLEAGTLFTIESIKLLTKNFYSDNHKISPDGKWVALINSKCRFQLRDTTGSLQKSRHIEPQSPHKEYYSCIIFSPNSKFVSTYQDKNSILLHNIDTGKSKLIKKECVERASFSPNSKFLAFTTGEYYVEKRKLQLYNTSTAESAWKKPISNVASYKFNTTSTLVNTLFVLRYINNLHQKMVQIYTTNTLEPQWEILINHSAVHEGWYTLSPNNNFLVVPSIRKKAFYLYDKINNKQWMEEINQEESQISPFRNCFSKNSNYLFITSVVKREDEINYHVLRIYKTKTETKKLRTIKNIITQTICRNHIQSTKLFVARKKKKKLIMSTYLLPDLSEEKKFELEDHKKRVGFIKNNLDKLIVEKQVVQIKMGKQRVMNIPKALILL